MTRRLRIAIVDDEEAVRKALKRLISAANHDGVTYASGADFLKALPANTPDCLVLDLQMPGMTALDVLECLAKAGARLPTVVITAHDEIGVREHCLDAGAFAYLCKPLDARVLLDTINSATPTKSVT